MQVISLPSHIETLITSVIFVVCLLSQRLVWQIPREKSVSLHQNREQNWIVYLNYCHEIGFDCNVLKTVLMISGS